MCRPCRLQNMLRCGPERLLPRGVSDYGHQYGPLRPQQASSAQAGHGSAVLYGGPGSGCRSEGSAASPGRRCPWSGPLGEYPGAAVAVGNAPTALLALCEQIASGPPGPGRCSAGGIRQCGGEQKIAFAPVSGAGDPCIAALGRKGGSTVAAAICNAFFTKLPVLLTPWAALQRWKKKKIKKQPRMRLLFVRPRIKAGQIRSFGLD